MGDIIIFCQGVLVSGRYGHGKLQELMGDGLVTRVQYNEMPLRVEYYLTDAGKQLFPILSQLTDWGEEQKKAEKE